MVFYHNHNQYFSLSFKKKKTLLPVCFLLETSIQLCTLFTFTKLNLSASSVLSLCLFHPPVRSKQAAAALLKKRQAEDAVCCCLISVLCLFSYSIHMVVHCFCLIFELDGHLNFLLFTSKKVSKSKAQ